MSDAFARAVERMRQARAARAAVASPDVPATAAPRRAPGRAFAPGDHVFDLVNGEYGLVEFVTLENVTRETPERSDDRNGVRPDA